MKTGITSLLVAALLVLAGIQFSTRVPPRRRRRKPVHSLPAWSLLQSRR